MSKYTHGVLLDGVCPACFLERVKQTPSPALLICTAFPNLLPLPSICFKCGMAIDREDCLTAADELVKLKEAGR